MNPTANGHECTRMGTAVSRVQFWNRIYGARQSLEQHFWTTVLWSRNSLSHHEDHEEPEGIVQPRMGIEHAVHVRRPAQQGDYRRTEELSHSVATAVAGEPVRTEHAVCPGRRCQTDART